MTKLSRWVLLLALALATPTIGCGPGPDDAAGQAGLLTDATKRGPAFENVQRLYHGALQAAGGDRTKAEVKAVVDATIEPLVHAYEASAGDLRLGRFILDLLAEMRDPRALPAFTRALDFELDAGERHAQTAANAVRDIVVPEAQKAALVTALERAVNKFPGDRAGNDARPADKVIQIDLIKTLGYLGEPAAEALGRIATSDNPKTDPAVVLAGAIYLGRVANAAAVPALVQCLFRSVQDGRVPLADFAIAGLVRVGRPAVQPLVRVFQGQDPAAITAATAAIATMRQANAGGVPASMTPQKLAQDRAMRALAALGVPEAMPLIAPLARTGELRTRFDAAMMLMQLTLPTAQAAEARTILIEVLTAASGDENAQIRAGLVSVAAQTFDSGLMPTVLARVADRREYAGVRMAAVTTYAMLANRAEATQLKAIIDSEPTIENDGLKEQLTPALPLVTVAIACDQDITCWRGKLGDSSPLVVRKAALMLGRFGQGNAQAIEALIPVLDHAQIDVRFAALYALDHIANSRAAAVITKLEQLSEREDPVSRQMQSETLRILSRIRTRTGS